MHVVAGVLLGAGSFGRVYKGTWRQLDVAVKASDVGGSAWDFLPADSGAVCWHACGCTSFTRKHDTWAHVSLDPFQVVGCLLRGSRP